MTLLLHTLCQKNQIVLKVALSWLHLRQDALSNAKTVVADTQQTIEAQQTTIEGLRELNKYLVLENNKLLAVNYEAHGAVIDSASG